MINWGTKLMNRVVAMALVAASVGGLDGTISPTRLSLLPPPINLGHVTRVFQLHMRGREESSSTSGSECPFH